ncbi:flavodoxin [Oscillospiraceae bacterium 44-5]
MKRILTTFLTLLLILGLAGCGNTGQQHTDMPADSTKVNPESNTPTIEMNLPAPALPEEFLLIKGGTFQMGSSESEAWRIEDETAHTVTLSDYYISQYEVTQEEYQAVMGTNPSAFSGENLPVDSVSWMDAILYCNARSTQEGLTPAYTVEGQNVSWDRSANGYRLPTEAEWEYACRAGTETPFNTETSISADEANYWGHYPYLIEDNYFSQGNLETRPGVYRQTTVAVGSFQPNAWDLYDMHGNVGEWVWDWYGSYETGEQTDPTGPDIGTLRVNRGGGWSDFAKNLRSAYRATLPPDSASFNLGLRLVRNAGNGSGNVESSSILGYPNWWASIPMPIASFLEEYDFSGKTIIPFCSHGGGRFGQSLTAITKLVPDAVLGEGLAISYSGGSSLADDVAEWLKKNGV